MRHFSVVLLLCATALGQAGGGKAASGGKASFGGGASAGGGTHTFSAPASANNRCYAATSSGSSVNCNLVTAPATGTFTTVSVMTFPSTITGVTVSDGTNSYAPTTNSPSAVNAATAGKSWVFYWYATTTGGTGLTATFTGATCADCSITVDTFGVTGAGAVVQDADPSGGNGSGTTINVPTATQSVSGELFWCFAVSQNGITSSGAPWTAEGHGLGTFGEESQFIPSSSGSQAINFGQASGTWDANCPSFK